MSTVVRIRKLTALLLIIGFSIYAVTLLLKYHDPCNREVFFTIFGALTLVSFSAILQIIVAIIKRSLRFCIHALAIIFFLLILYFSYYILLIFNCNAW